jgi:hypothetical protein
MRGEGDSSFLWKRDIPSVKIAPFEDTKRNQASKERTFCPNEKRGRDAIRRRKITHRPGRG